MKYAEETLGVHKVYGDAKALAGDIDAVRLELAAQRRQRVSQEEAYTDEELAFVADMRADNPDLSQTAFDKFIKSKIRQNPKLCELRGGLAVLRHVEELTEIEIKRLQHQLEITIARMTELGGYLNYLAAIKTAETAKLAVPRDDWPPDSAVSPI